MELRRFHVSLAAHMDPDAEYLLHLLPDNNAACSRSQSAYYQGAFQLRKQMLCGQRWPLFVTLNS